MVEDREDVGDVGLDGGVGDGVHSGTGFASLHNKVIVRRVDKVLRNKCNIVLRWKVQTLLFFIKKDEFIQVGQRRRTFGTSGYCSEC